MWPSYFIVYLVSILWVAVVTNAADTNVFIFPPAVGASQGEGLVFPEGAIKSIRLRTTAPDFSIRMFQALLNESSTILAQGDVWSMSGSAPCEGCSEEYQFQWKVKTYGTDLSLSPVYYFQVFPVNRTYTPFISHGFNITKSGGFTPTAASTGSTTNSASTAGSTSTAATQNSSNQPSRGSTHPLKVGLGVGLGVGIPLVLILGLVLGIIVGRKRRSEPSGAGLSTPHYGLAEKDGSSRPQQKPVFEVSGDSVKHELSGQDDPTELSADRVR